MRVRTYGCASIAKGTIIRSWTRNRQPGACACCCSPQEQHYFTLMRQFTPQNVRPAEASQGPVRSKPKPQHQPKGMSAAAEASVLCSPTCIAHMHCPYACPYALHICCATHDLGPVLVLVLLLVHAIARRRAARTGTSPASHKCKHLAQRPPALGAARTPHKTAAGARAGGVRCSAHLVV